MGLKLMHQLMYFPIHSCIWICNAIRIF